MAFLALPGLSPSANPSGPYAATDATGRVATARGRGLGGRLPARLAPRPTRSPAPTRSPGPPRMRSPGPRRSPWRKRSPRLRLPRWWRPCSWWTCSPSPSLTPRNRGREQDDEGGHGEQAPAPAAPPAGRRGLLACTGPAGAAAGGGASGCPASCSWPAGRTGRGDDRRRGIRLGRLRGREVVTRGHQVTRHRGQVVPRLRGARRLRRRRRRHGGCHRRGELGRGRDVRHRAAGHTR